MMTRSSPESTSYLNKGFPPSKWRPASASLSPTDLSRRRRQPPANDRTQKSKFCLFYLVRNQRHHNTTHPTTPCAFTVSHPIPSHRNIPTTRNNTLNIYGLLCSINTSSFPNYSSCEEDCAGASKHNRHRRLGPRTGSYRAPQRDSVPVCVCVATGE